MQTLSIKCHILLLTAAVSLLAMPRLHAELYPLWELGVGIGGLTLPDYRGSNEQRNLLFPIPYFIYRGEILKVDREKIRGLLFKTERVELDFSLNGSPPVKSKNNKAREGMPNLDPTLEFGPQLNVLLWEDKPDYKLTFQLPLRKVIATDLKSAHNAGLISNPILNLDIKISDSQAGISAYRVVRYLPIEPIINIFMECRPLTQAPIARLIMPPGVIAVPSLPWPYPSGFRISGAVLLSVSMTCTVPPSITAHC